MATMAQLLDAHAESIEAQAEPARLAHLQSIGVPIDLLPFFSWDGESVSGGKDTPINALDAPRPTGTHAAAGSTWLDDSAAWVREALARRRAGMRGESLRRLLTARPFRFRQAVPGYRVCVEDGTHEPGLLRLQLPQAEYERGAGDGSALDVLRQLVEQVQSADVLISIEDAQVDRFARQAAGWRIGREGRMRVIAELQVVGQWAQDNGKPGLAPRTDGGIGERIVTLSPRYASRGEEKSNFAPEESAVLDGLRAAGLAVAQSPLLFQGGNLLAFRRPRDGRRVLLVGEAEVYRNTALGLTPEQALEALRIEFGVDVCTVLPAASFHVDFEVTVRAVGNESVAFVNDDLAAARLVLAHGVQAMQANGVAGADWATRALSALDSGAGPDAVSLIGGVVIRQAGAQGVYPEAFARVFTRDATESPAANLQRFLMALDIYAAAVMPEDQMPPAPSFRAYMRTFRRRAADREEIRARLTGQGCRVVAVPSMSDTDRGLNYLNGLHTPGTYYMPVAGGFYQGLDDAAADAVKRGGGALAVVPIRTGASQARLGAIHCAVSVLPRPGSAP